MASSTTFTTGQLPTRSSSFESDYVGPVSVVLARAEFYDPSFEDGLFQYIELGELPSIDAALDYVLAEDILPYEDLIEGGPVSIGDWDEDAEGVEFRDLEGNVVVSLLTPYAVLARPRRKPQPTTPSDQALAELRLRLQGKAPEPVRTLSSDEALSALRRKLQGFSD